MCRYRKISFFLFSIFLCAKSFSQVFGGEPASTKWKQINIVNSRIIFPAGLDSIATRVSNIIRFTKDSTEQTIGRKSKKINIVLHNHTTVANAYVALGPFRSEFYLTPDQNSFEIGSLPWPDQLTIHEYRHVEQYNNFNVGLSKVMHILFGQEGQALANSAAVPNWFFEGDAVFNETNLSRQGRGSLAFFYNGYRSLWQAGKNYSWMKLRNGSLKDYTPDHYALGYLLVAYGRERYGDDFWKWVSHNAAAYKSLFYPFQHAIKKQTGVSYITFRNDALEYFKKEFAVSNDSSRSGLGAFRNEEFPSFTEDGSVIFVKSSYKEVPEFVIQQPNGKEQKIRVQDYTLYPYFSYRNGKIVYASYRPDVRWGFRNYSDLQILDVANGHQQTLTRKGKYFSPDISNNGQKMVAVHEPPSGNDHLQLLNLQSGKVLDEIPNPDHLFYTDPKFIGNDTLVSAVRNKEGEMSLQLIDLASLKTKYLLPFSYNVIGFPCVYHDTLYFTYAYKKNDELFAYTFTDEKLWKINSNDEPGLGKYYVSANDSEIIWSTFTAEGYRMQQARKDSLHFEEIPLQGISRFTSNFGITATRNTNANLLYSVPNDTLKIEKYAKSFQLFNFHSMEPSVDDPVYTLSLLSENILNTLQSSFSFSYDRAEKYKEFSFAATYAGWFPFLTAGVNYFFDRSTLYHQQLIRFNQFQPYLGFSIPFNFSKGRSFTYLNVGSQGIYSQPAYKGSYKDTLSRKGYAYGSNFLSFTHQIQQAKQQIFPRFAQTISLSYKLPYTQYKGFQYMANANFYLPGIFKTHSTVLNLAYLHKDSINQVSFSSNFPFSRGYQSVNFYKMYKWGINYHLPLALPDWGFANLFYLLRVRANLFYDDTRGQDFYDNNTSYKETFRSAGTEIMLDTKWWNEVDISFGIRYSRLLNEDLYGGSGHNRWEIILPVNIFSQ